MFNTLPPSIKNIPGQGGVRKARPPLNRRGGQPSNRNAFKHGLYSAKTPTPLRDILASAASSRKMPDDGPGAYSRAVRESQQQYCQLMEFRNKAENFRLALAADKLMLKTFRKIIRLKQACFKQELPGRNLQFVSKYSLDIIRLNICDLGIPRDADSFRATLEKSDFNSLIFQESPCASRSDPPYPFITPRQWRVLEPLLPPPDPIRRRGRPPADPRQLLDAVFWKFAHHARWKDLPEYYPPSQACRRYYRRLFLSGRLATLYSALYAHLVARKEVDLTLFVQKGCFTIKQNKLLLHLELDDIWQMRTALLFLQLGYHVYCRVGREIKLQRRLGFTSCRILSAGKVFDPSTKKSPESSFNPFDLSDPGPGGRK
jgi:transposase